MLKKSKEIIESIRADVIKNIKGIAKRGEYYVEIPFRYNDLEQRTLARDASSIIVNELQNLGYAVCRNDVLNGFMLKIRWGLD